MLRRWTCFLLFSFMRAYCNENDLFIAQRDGEYVCATNSSFALSWTNDDLKEALQQVSSFIPQTESNSFDNDIKDDSHTNIHFVKSPWTLKKSIELILDRRWEEIKTIRTEFQYLRDLLYTPVLSSLKPDFDIFFSLRAHQEAHIFLCDGPYPPEANCYWLMLQAFSGNKSALRKCKSSAIPISAPVPNDKSCRILLFEVNHPVYPKYLSSQKWTHLEVRKNGNTLGCYQIGHNLHKEIVLFQDGDTVLNVTHMIVHSKQETAFWKIHELDFLYTDKETELVQLGPDIYSKTDDLCISMFISMCELCRIKLTLTSEKRTIAEKIYRYEKTGWTEIKFVVEELPRSSNIKLLVSTISEYSNRFWKIDSVRLCDKNEFRIISLTEQADCQLMDTDTVISVKNNTIVPSESKCREDAIGPFCAPCKSIFHRNCNYVRICTQKQCVCSAGFDSRDNCFYPCREKSYGHGCQKQCGRCTSSYFHPCDHLDGTCNNHNSCLDNYSGPKCDIPPSISFTDPPKIFNITYTAATITMTNFTIIHLSKSNRPTSYTLQYKKAEIGEDDWKFASKKIKLNDKVTITIDNLEPNTLYTVRSVITAADDTTYDGAYVKTSNFSTDCEDLTEQNIELSKSSRKVEIHLVNTTKIQCAKNKYKISIRNDTSAVDFDNLNPFTNYTIFFRRNSNLLQTGFQTNEAIPTQIQDLKAINISSSSMTVKWQKPVFYYGQFKYYIVEYHHVSYTSCKSTTTPRTHRRETKENLLILYNLTPFSSYSISVAAANTKYTGPVTHTIVNTSASDEIGTEEVPSVKYAIGTDSVKFTVSTITCNRLQGPLLAKLNIICGDDWCKPSNSKQFQDQWPFSIIVFKTLPFTEYQVEFVFCRNGTHCSTSHQRKKFRTKATAPNEVTDLLVYSKNDTSISLRWKPPQPPNGILATYKIEYNEFKQILTKTPCKLWPEFDCATLTNLKKDTNYIFQVSARNENPPTFGTSQSIKGLTKKEKSKAPYDVRFTWSIHNDLELEWKHPNQTNGKINFFSIVFTANFTEQKPVQIPVTENAYSLVYFYKISSTELSPSTFYSIRISANNGYDGEIAAMTDTSPPIIPQLVKNPKITTSSSTILVEVTPEIYNKSGDSTYGLVLLFPENNSCLDTKNLTIQQTEDLLNRSTVAYNSNNFAKKVSVTMDSNSTSGDNYNILLILKNSVGIKSSYKIYCLTGSISTPNFALLALLFLLLLIPIVIIFLKRRKLKDYFKKENATEYEEEYEYPMSNFLGEHKDQKLEDDKSYENTCVLENTLYTKSIKVEEFREYVEKSDSTKELELQHEMILNIRNSVTYIEVQDNQYFDYVDMEFSDGTTTSKAYITAECPNRESIDTFWKHIWEENVLHIVLLISPEKTPVEKYYPDKNTKMEHHSISIQLAFSKVVANYEYKTFILIKNDEIRHVNQIEFSYQGFNPIQFVPLFKKILTFPLITSSPIFVHSNGHIEKVGFVLLCDMCLRMAERDGTVDVLKILKILSDHKSDMICNIEMYKLVHMVILEIICNGDYEAVLDSQYENF